MVSEVKMPQLGMTQDSGVIVAWLKTAGDRVSAGEVLFEVETDKATMEVEAAADGFLAGICAGEGDDVPVGDVIAVIVKTEAQVADHPTALQQLTTTHEAEAEAPPAPQVQPAPDTDPGPLPVTVPAQPSGRVLASPKARRIAAARGLDLASLGLAEPIHVSDLGVATAGGGQSALAARVSAAALNALLARAEGADRTMLFAAFAAGAWRALFSVEDLAVALRGPDGSRAVVPNPDRGGSSETNAPALSVVDLCDTRLTSFVPAGGGVTLSAARDGDDLHLTLAFGEATLPLAQAIALLDDIAARVENPIRQLL